MRRHFYLLLLVLGVSGLVGLPVARADIAVIVHRSNPVQAMTPREVSDIYLGRVRSLGRGEQKVPVVFYEYDVDHPLRETFFRSLNGMAITQVNSYWARLRFSGEVSSPPALPDGRAVVDAVSRNPNAIGYIETGIAVDSVKVVLRLKETAADKPVTQADSR